MRKSPYPRTAGTRRPDYSVSINTLLGESRKLICQCCGMPIDDDSILGRDKDGTLNEEYCKWCYADGTYTYNDMDFILVCTYEKDGENPELLIYKKR